MIQSRENLVWVRNEAEQLEPFDERRLAQSVLRAAGEAEDASEMAEAVAGAVWQYAHDRAAERVVAVKEIGEMVQALLLILGYDELSRQYGAGADIRLDEMAARSGVGFELAFYRDLDAALGSRERRSVRLVGLRECVLQLRGADRWGVACRRLAEEILGHVYARAMRARLVNLAVVE